jgi:CBS domain-containing protein
MSMLLLSYAAVSTTVARTTLKWPQATGPRPRNMLRPTITIDEANVLKGFRLTVDSEDSLQFAASLLRHARLTGAPVSEDDSVTGIFSRNDMLRAIAAIPENASPEALEAEMTRLRCKEVWQVVQGLTKPVTIRPDATLFEAAKLMTEKRFNRIMVQGRYGPVLGAVTSTDVVFSVLGCTEDAARELLANGLDQHSYEGDLHRASAAERPAVSPAEGRVQDWMATKLTVIPPQMTLQDAGVLLRAAGITGAPVVENGRVLGALSRFDLLRAIHTAVDVTDESGFVKQIEQLRAAPVRSVMKENPVTISPGASILEAARILADGRLNRLVVTTDEGSTPGSLVGMLSSTDVCFAVLGDGGDEQDEALDDALNDPNRAGNLYRPGIY